MKANLGNIRIKSTAESYLKIWIHIYEKISNNCKSVLNPNLTRDSLSLLTGLRYILVEEDEHKKLKLLRNYIDMTMELDSFISILSFNKEISTKQEANLIELLLDIRTQATDWANSIEKRLNNQSKVE